MEYGKIFIGVILGGALGFAGGYYLGKKKEQARADEEIEEMKKYYLEKHLKEVEKNKEIASKIDEKILAVEEEYGKSEKVAETGNLRPLNGSQKIKYNKIGEEETVLAEKESPEEDEASKPYLITEEEYLDGKNDYDKLSFTYYTYDDTLADDCDEMVDVEETISSEIYNQIADSEGDLFVRNPVIETDFEIMKVEASFKERYGGI